ncbi:MAG: hypothetical protein H0T60_03480, partial [Acidobacteria bacterium]|nr:hypothetical protein [Acidobacteriota bacterium]
VESEPASKIATELRQIAAHFSHTAQSAITTELRRGLLGSLFRRDKAVEKVVSNQLTAIS